MLQRQHIALTAIRPSPFQVRKRMDLAGLQDLAQSLAKEGQLHPILVRPREHGYELIAGERRWRAMWLVPGALTIQARVIEATDVQSRRMLAAENVKREALSPLEWVEAIVEIVDAELSEDPIVAGYGDTPLVRVRTLLTKWDSDRRRNTDHVSHKFMGQVEHLFAQLPKPIDWRSFLENDLPLLTKLNTEVQAVAIAAKLSKDRTKALGALQQHAPEKFREVIRQRGLKAYQDLGDCRAGTDDVRPLKEVSARELRALAAHEAMRRARHQPAVIETPPVPQGTYRCLVIDPPWPMAKSEREVRPSQGDHLNYPVMSLEAMEALPIAALADPAGCHVYLWVTQRFLPAGLGLFEAWGVTYQCVLTWVKPTGMTPYSWIYNTEHVLFGRVGTLPLTVCGRKLSFEASVERHSAKPEVFYAVVRAVSPSPRLDMFARRACEGFQGWGHEVRREPCA
jgi:N6-adenosine-specific RNA methylase IME4